MANERKTERIVRSYFEQYEDLIKIEEQSSGLVHFLLNFLAFLTFILK